MAQFEINDLTLEEGARNIYGRIYLPNEALEGSRIPLVIISHGLGGNHESGDAYAQELARRGYAAYCFDFGGTPGSRSTGNQLEMSLQSEQDDLEFVYDQLSNLPYVDLNNVFLFGISMGGAVSALAAASLKKLIKGLILLYPAFNIPSETQAQWPDFKEIPDSFTIFDIELGRAFAEGAYFLDIYRIIEQYAGPVLILHGIADEIVASGYSVRAANTFRHVQLELIDGAGHGFTGGVFKYAVKKIVGFLDEEADLPDESGLDGDLNFSGGMGMFG